MGKLKQTPASGNGSDLRNQLSRTIVPVQTELRAIARMSERDTRVRAARPGLSLRSYGLRWLIPNALKSIVFHGSGRSG
jgi:hypothetical protein